MINVLEIPERKGLFWGDSVCDDFKQALLDDRLRGRRTLVVTGERTLGRLGVERDLRRAITEEGLLGHLRFGPNPTETEIREHLGAAGEAEAFLAVGGGSPIDAAKALRQWSGSRAPLVSFYTVPGSASIVSPFVVYGTGEFKVGSLVESGEDDMSCVCEDVLATLPASLVAGAACDIFGHAFESCASLAATDASRVYSRDALRRLEAFLERGRWTDLIHADLIAGVAESFGVVLFPHAVGHYLTHRHGVPHALATAVYTVPYLELLAGRGVPEAAEFLPLALRIVGLADELGLVPRPALEADEARTALRLIERHMPFALANAPIPLTEADYVRLISRSMPSR